MRRIVFLVEEPSMKRFLDGFLPRVIPGAEFLCVPHEGKGDLERSIPRKLRAWREPGVEFVVVRDNDGGDCKVLKRRLRRACSVGGRPKTLIRIVCQELEAWYLGDLPALSRAYQRPGIAKQEGKARLRDPDAVVSPSGVLEGMIPEFQKLSCARLMAQVLDPASNRSRSLQVFVDGVRNLADS